jgi:hypothetical protein
VEGVLPAVSSHAQNFVDAIRGDDTLRAAIGQGHLSASLCHLGNIAARVGRTLQFDPQRERIVGDDAADALLTREYRSGHWAVPGGIPSA